MLEAPLTIGVCHPAYQIATVLRQRLPEAKVFQETSADALAEKIAAVDVLVISGAWRDSLLKPAGRLRWIQSIGAGYNQFPLEALQQRGIRLTNAAGVNAQAVSEHAMALILALTRRLPEARDNQRQKSWRPMISEAEKRETELAGKTLGIVGIGAIGNRITTLAKAFGMRVIGTKGSPSIYQGLADEVLGSHQLEDLLRAADVVVLCCPLTLETHHLVDANALRQMRPAAYLINVARGPVVDEGALITALRTGQIAGAGLDVAEEEPLPAESPLWSLPNVLLTPHSGGETTMYERRLCDIIVENVERWSRGEPFINQIA